jgi:hypothetical protein
MMRAVRKTLPLLVIAACSRDTQTQPVRAASATADAGVAGACALTARPFARPAPRRLVAIGDLHGDLAAARAALTLAGAIDDTGHWAGGDLTVVQTGDILDRGDGEEAILELFEQLEREAADAGGSFTWLLGNHELMNAAGDFRYVTKGGWDDFTDRTADFHPGGRYAKVLAGQDIAVKIGDTVFSHAGFLPTWTDDPAAMNRSADCWLAGAGPEPAVETADDGPVWTRAWGGPDADCDFLRQTLTALDAKRMVVAHTPQEGGINSLCDGALWRIDTGLASYYGGPMQVLEITDAGVNVLRVSSP